MHEIFRQIWGKSAMSLTTLRDVREHIYKKFWQFETEESRKICINIFRCVLIVWDMCTTIVFNDFGYTLKKIVLELKTIFLNKL